jgi:signal transduction histidine kinase
MSTQNRTYSGIRRDLILALSGIIVLSGIISYIVIFVAFRYTFDQLVRQNDKDSAASFARELSAEYQELGSWDQIGKKISEIKNDTDPGSGKKIHLGMPVVIIDANGMTVYPVADRGQHVYKVNDGFPVLYKNTVVGAVFFKSMLKRSYNAHERSFYSSMTAFIGFSVLTGIIMAVIVGSFAAARFVKPVISLEKAVRSIAEGSSGVRAETGTPQKNEIYQLAAEFNMMADKLEQTEASRKQLLADMAHELRTPVSIIQGNLEMMLAGIYHADEKRLQSLYDETKLLTGLIADLRVISDLESGMLPVAVDPVSLSSLVSESYEKYGPLFSQKNSTLVVQHVSAALVSGDEDRLRHVLRNILMNALKYSAGSSTVTICGTVSDHSYLVSVADEGPGVPAADLEKIFERFYRVDQSRNRDSGGRGLGLAICRQFVTSCNGMIYARNKQPRGLEIVITLPLFERPEA